MMKKQKPGQVGRRVEVGKMGGGPPVFLCPVALHRLLSSPLPEYCCNRGSSWPATQSQSGGGRLLPPPDEPARASSTAPSAPPCSPAPSLRGAAQPSATASAAKKARTWSTTAKKPAVAGPPGGAGGVCLSDAGSECDWAWAPGGAGRAAVMVVPIWCEGAVVCAQWGWLRLRYDACLGSCPRSVQRVREFVSRSLFRPQFVGSRPSQTKLDRQYALHIHPHRPRPRPHR